MENVQIVFIEDVAVPENFRNVITFFELREKALLRKEKVRSFDPSI